MFADFEFRYPFNGLYVILAVVAVLFLILAFRKKERIMAAVGLEPGIRLKPLRAALLGAGFGLMIFSLLGPQVFDGYLESDETGLDIYVLIDTSKSMLVPDAEPDRIGAAKTIVSAFLDRLHGDRVGFIPFASDAYVQMPLTNDYQLAHMFLNVIDTDMIGGGGTNLAAAISLAGDSFARTTSADKVLLIVSDGEDHDGASLDIAQSLTDGRLKIFAVGVGSENGGQIPIYNRAGTRVRDYIRDEDGDPVTSRLDSGLLRQLARTGDGSYYQASALDSATSALLTDLSSLQRARLEARTIRKYRQLYQYFLAAGIFLFLIVWFLPERRANA